MPSIQPAVGGVSFATVLTILKGRLLEALATDGIVVKDDYVRIVARPNPNYADYKAEEGISLIAHVPEPNPLAGAGRHGYLTNRVLEVHVATQSLLDPAGKDEIAVLAHLALEESVVNVVLDSRPPSIQTDPERAGIRTKWIPGGLDITRQVKVDPGMIFGVILFDVQYVPPLLVLRD